MDEVIEKLLPAVEEQLQASATPYVKETLDHLVQDHEISEEEAKAMIAFCLADEIEALGREERDFSAERYQTLLSLLPAMPEGK